MLYWILIFLIAAILFGGLSFSGIIGAVIFVAIFKFLFFVCLVLLVATIIKHLMSAGAA